MYLLVLNDKPGYKFSNVDLATELYILMCKLCNFYIWKNKRVINMTTDDLHALKIAFSYMPQAIEVNKYVGTDAETQVAILNGFNFFPDTTTISKRVVWPDYVRPGPGSLRIALIGEKEFSGKVLAEKIVSM